MTDRPSDRALALAFWKTRTRVLNFDEPYLNANYAEIEKDAREIDAAAPDGVQPATVDEALASKVYDVLCGRNPPQRRHGYPDWEELSADCREEYIETAAALAVVFRSARDAGGCGHA